MLYKSYQHYYSLYFRKYYLKLYKTLCQIRYNGNKSNGIISKNNNELIVKFEQPQLAITPGQSIVFYSKNILAGGGIITLNE